jgi:hypothetical protein
MERAKEERREVVRAEVSVLADIFSTADLACIARSVCVLHAVLCAALVFGNNG